MNGFSRIERDGIPFYVCLNLDRFAGLRHGFSTRHGGVSKPGTQLNLSPTSWDDPESVLENRRRFLAATGTDKGHLATLVQVHSDQVHIIRKNPDQWNGRARGDALATVVARVALAVQVADCFPILIVDPISKAVAAIHAGWRGVLSHVVAKTIAAMQEAFDTDAGSLYVAIGPGIRACCFEVGRDVADLFRCDHDMSDLVKPHPIHAEKLLLDLAGVLRVQFRDCGIDPEKVSDMAACTCCNAAEFFSYRRERARSGRMMGLIGWFN